MPDAMLDTEGYKGKLADAQSCHVWTLYLCEQKENQTMKNIFIFLKLFFFLKEWEEAYSTIKQKKQGKIHFVIENKVQEESV